MTDVEARVTLQAWTFLRANGVQPGAQEADVLLGVVVEAPVRGGHDVLAAYLDRTARYLNHAGGRVIDEATTRHPR